MQVTDEEVDEAGLAVKGYIWANVPSWTGADHVSAHDLRGIARAAILAYLATPGQVRMREDVERWNLKPMNTAQKDGRELLLQVTPRHGRWRGRFLVGHYMPGGHCIDDHPPIDAGWYFWNGRMFDRASEPVGWTELPTAIDAARAAEGES